MLGKEELRELGEDIRKNRLQHRVVLWSPNGTDEAVLLDGRNRLDAMELVGMPVLNKSGGEGWRALNGHLYTFHRRKCDPVAYIVAANIKRRHLDTEQKRELIAKLLKANPEKSNRQIAEPLKVDHKTVASVRVMKETTGEIPQLTKTTGKDGKTRPTKPRPAKKQGAEPPPSSPQESREDCQLRILQQAWKTTCEVARTRFMTWIETDDGRAS
jgi:hypothetical protein